MKMRKAVVLVFIPLGMIFISAQGILASMKVDQSEHGNPFQRDAHCFCRLEGRIDDCQCDVESVDHFNNQKVFPVLQSLLEMSYFRYFQYNPHRKCPFWDTSNEVCKSGTCGVKPCSKEELPVALKQNIECQPVNPDDMIDESISDEVLVNLKKNDKEASEFFCDLDSETGADCDVVDLSINPERYTGYAEEGAHRIWRAIYNENCFKNSSDSKFDEDSLKGMCLEERAFFRTVSGLHTSITIHLTSRYPLDKLNGKPKIFSPVFPKIVNDKYGPNLGEFLNRFDPDLTNNQGPFWLRNLYFVYLLELRAIVKAAPVIANMDFSFGNEDTETAKAVNQLLHVAKNFPNHFDETKLFADGDQLDTKQQFRDHFYNITRIMDCVTCDKCKLWGKLQMTGLATALKILFTEPSSAETSGDVSTSGFPQLSRNEVVALFNAFGRISTSIRQLEVFREMVQLKKKDEL